MEDVRVLERSEQLRALAHPLRIRMLTRLQHEGPATATMLARALGESSGATSFHLRQLARYELIQEVPRSGRGRWWEASARHYDLAPGVLDSPEQGAAAAQLLARVLERDAAVVSAYLENRDRYEPLWRDAGVITNHVFYATAKELEQLSERLQTAFADYAREQLEDRPSNAIRLYGVLRLVPWDAGVAPQE